MALRAAAVEPRIAAVIADGPNLVDQRDFPPFEKASDLPIWLLVFTEARLKELILGSWAPPSASETIVGRMLASVAIIMALFATAALAEMPEELKGSWVIDAQASEEQITASPEWKPEDEKYLPTIMKRMSQALYEFEDDAIVVLMGEKKHVISVALKETSSRKYIFEGTIGDNSITVTVSFVDDATINIRVSSSNDMDYFLWKRGQLAAGAGVDDNSLAIELMVKSLESSSKKTDGGDGR